MYKYVQIKHIVKCYLGITHNECIYELHSSKLIQFQRETIKEDNYWDGGHIEIQDGG